MSSKKAVVPGSSHRDQQWWREAVIYQVYPNSFACSNGDGIGDLVGIASKLDYLKSLGVDVVWLSPIYKSPQKDMGYDISDYRNIHEDYGTLEDWDRLVDGLHKRGMKLMMDLVVNHTSDQHAWFRSSRSSKTDPKRDWYVWRPAKHDADGNRVPPNNWGATFRGGGSAWTWDEATQEYYLRLYTPEQPDLNWENPDVRHEVYSVMKFWLDRGTDGFRMDVINHISKAPTYPDAKVVEPNEPFQPPWEHAANGPRVHEFLREMHREVLSKYDVITVGETPFTADASVLVEYVLPENKELQMVFCFDHMYIDDTGPALTVKPWKLTDLKKALGDRQRQMYDLGGWNSLYLENHDQARSVSRFGNDSERFRAISVKMLALFHCTLSGTVYIYQGQEIGVKNLPRSWKIEDYPDVATQVYYADVLEQRRKATGKTWPDMSDVMSGIQHKARDHARSPIAWTAGPNGGFTSEKARPWMRMDEGDRKEWNVEKQVREQAVDRAGEQSVFGFWKDTLAFRKANPACTYGKYEPLAEDDERVYCFVKSHDRQSLLVVVNFNPSELDFAVPLAKRELLKTKPVASNYPLGESGQGGKAKPDEVERVRKGQVRMRAYEAVVYEL